MKPGRIAVGAGVVVLGIVVASVNAWAFRAYPDSWGGPDIGGGFIQLCAYAAVVVGAVLLARGLRGRRRRR
ncbi:hypothetical protein [Lapillicoccus jejuensis]|uniref:Uncharacterized protein n=1 Tax=Lapillicoccus jejuensis TaxID=402171 RepID=A0A542DVE5_9MICO|nr:hypothetical protein [Lapillicoccus jejuensis]TQJ07057.1 hypothetical protein FB458_0103 [Lapillicoccus jejuensis]